MSHDARIEDVLAVADVISRIEKLTRRLFEFTKFKTAYINRTVSMIARTRGYSAQLEKEERDALFGEARNIVDGAVKKGIYDDIAADVASDLQVLVMSVDPIVTRIKEIENEMRRLASLLPVHAWQKQISGFGELGLAILIGCAGNPSDYSTKHKFKKRLAIAPFTRTDGVTRACSTWAFVGGLSKDEWCDDPEVGYKGPGYAKKRRVASFGYVQDSMLKWQVMGAKKSPDGIAKPKGRYGQLMLEYKQRQMEKNERGEFAELAAAIVAKHRSKQIKPNKENLAGRLTQQHINNRAARYMVQRLICDLWFEWRRATSTVLETASSAMPASTLRKKAA